MAELSDLEKLKQLAAMEDQLTYRELFLRGIDFSFYQKPTTIKDFKLAKKQSQDKEDLVENSARLFCNKACNAAGDRKYVTAEALPILIGQLSMKSALKLMNTLKGLDDEEGDEDNVLDLKSPSETAQKGPRAVS